MTLTKQDIVNRIHKSNLHLTQSRSREAVETILAIIKSSLENGDDVLLTNFGKFSIKNKNARRGRNPQTGKSIMLKPRKIATFKPSGKLLEKINKK